MTSLPTSPPRWARDHNNGRPKPAWSTGEKLAVALVLGDQALLDAEGYTREQAKQRLAGDILSTDVDGWLRNIRAAL